MNLKQVLITFHHLNYVIGLLFYCKNEHVKIPLSMTSKKPFVLIYLLVYFAVTQRLAHVSGNLNPGTLSPVSFRNLCRDTHLRESPAFPAPTASALTGRLRHRLMMSCGRFQLSSCASVAHAALRQQQVLHITVTVTRVHMQTHTPHTHSKPRPCGQEQNCRRDPEPRISITHSAWCRRAHAYWLNRTIATYRTTPSTASLFLATLAKVMLPNHHQHLEENIDSI